MRSLKELPTDNWMSCLPDTLQELPLFHLAIPGSHNTITYCLDRSYRFPVDLKQPALLQKLDKCMKPITRPFVHKWAVTQESSVKQQLDSGVRYCDLRIAHRVSDSSNDLYFYHGVYTTVTVEAVLKEIKEWLDVHAREVVILSFSHFQELNLERHSLLIHTIKSVFASKLCPKSETLTLKNLWAKGLQVIVSYEHSIAANHDQLWTHIPYWWANKSSSRALVEELENRKQEGRPAGLFVAGINLTVDMKYICLHPLRSLRDMVMSTYPTLLSWVQIQRPGPDARCVNIVAGDFVSESHLVPAVIGLNEKLLNGYAD